MFQLLDGRQEPAGVGGRTQQVGGLPCSLVYRAFTDPDQLAQWFGPAGISVPRESVDMDVRPGGHQRLSMTDGSGAVVSRVDATFVEVVENELVVGQEGGMTLRIEFHPEGDDRTRLVIIQGPLPTEYLEGARAGWGTSWAKLEKVLAG